MDPATAGLFALALALGLLARYAARKERDSELADRVEPTTWLWPRSERTAIVRAVDRSYDSLARRRAS